jgi:hypothetical protein
MAYETCADVSPEFWRELQDLNPEDMRRRTGATREKNQIELPILNRKLCIDVERRRVQDTGRPGADPGFRVCLTALMYLLRLDVNALGPPTSPLDLTGGATFFQGHHGTPHAPLEERFGKDAAAFRRAGEHLQAELRQAGDAALAFQVFPGLWVEVILWEADEEFPAQASFTVPAHLERFWGLDAVWGLLNLVKDELLAAAG